MQETGFDPQVRRSVTIKEMALNSSIPVSEEKEFMKQSGLSDWSHQTAKSHDLTNIPLQLSFHVHLRVLWRLLGTQMFIYLDSQGPDLEPVQVEKILVSNILLKGSYKAPRPSYWQYIQVKR